MPKIEHWDNLPEGVRQHLIDRMGDRQSASPISINSVSGLNRSRRCRKVTGTRTSVHSRSAARARIPRRSCFVARLPKASYFEDKFAKGSCEPHIETVGDRQRKCEGMDFGTAVNALDSE